MGWRDGEGATVSQGFLAQNHDGFGLCHILDDNMDIRVLCVVGKAAGWKRVELLQVHGPRSSSNGT